MQEPIDELLEWLHTFDDLQFSCNHRNVIEKIWQIKSKQQFDIPVVGWRSEQLPDFDLDEINEIVKDCKEKKEDLQALICRIWNKGYMTAVADEREG